MNQLSTANVAYQSPRHQNSDVAFASKYQSITFQAGQLKTRPMSFQIFKLGLIWERINLQAILEHNMIYTKAVKNT